MVRLKYLADEHRVQVSCSRARLRRSRRLTPILLDPVLLSLTGSFLTRFVGATSKVHALPLAAQEMQGSSLTGRRQLCLFLRPV